MRNFIQSPQRSRSSRDEDEQEPTGRRGLSDDDDRERDDEKDGSDGKEQRHKSKPKFSGARAVKQARQYIAELTGQIPESVSGLTQTDGGWKVALDVVELERVPRTTDVLASYEVELDEHGELVGYHRIGRYYRNQVDER